MTESIRRQLVVPPYVAAIHLAVGLGMLATGIALVAASSGAAVTPLVPEAELAEVTPPAPAPAPRAAIAASEAAAPIADEIKLVFRADGASYMRLADLDRAGDGGDAGLPRPRHAAPRHVQ